MATSYVDVLWSLLDDYGELAAGAKIFSYEGGTDTPLVTYQDLDGEVENENPVELDAAARATIRLTNGVSYKFVVKDADGNTLFTRDFITVGELDGTTTTEIYPVHLEFLGTPDAGQVIGMFILEDAVTFPANFTATGLNSSGSVKGNPAADYTISVQVAGDEKGTIVIDTDGLITWATTGGAAWSGVKYDQIDAIGDDYDGSLADICLLLLASVDTE